MTDDSTVFFNSLDHVLWLADGGSSLFLCINPSLPDGSQRWRLESCSAVRGAAGETDRVAGMETIVAEPCCPAVSAPSRPAARARTRHDVELASDMACDNPRCRRFGVQGGGNIIVRWRYGADLTRFLKCLACKQRFSERRGSPLFQLKLPRSKIVEVLRLVADGVPCRQIASRCRVCRDTVQRISRAIGDRAREALDILCPDPDRVELQMDTVNQTLVTNEPPASPFRDETIRATWARLTRHLHHRKSGGDEDI